MTKRLFQTICLLMAFVSMQAARVVDGINYEFYRDQNMAVVEPLPNRERYTGDIVIPETVTVGDMTFTVVAIDKEAFYRATITSVSIPNTVTMISTRAFGDCYKLKSVVIPNSVTIIGNEAFSNCESATTLILPEKIDLILSNAFYGMCSLKEVVIPDGWTDLGSLEYQGEELDVYSLFEDCTSLEKVTIGRGVRAINPSTFAGCSSLKEVVCFDDGALEVIGEEAFDNCRSLKNLNFLPSTVKIIADAFDGCTAFTEIVVPASVIRFDCYFSDSYNVKKVVLKDSPEPITINGFEVTPSEVYLGRPCNGMPFNTNYFRRNNGTWSNYLKKVTFGPHFTGDSSWKFGWGVETIMSLVTDPAKLTFTFENDVYDNAILYVPKGTKESYRARDNFKNFFFINEFDATGIEAPHSQSGQEQSACRQETRYDLGGRQTRKQPKGISIVRTKEGLTKKIYVKP